jgi:arylsulfatase A-like enzyme
LADDLGWKDVGFMGNEVFETPNLDRLADHGMVFTQGYSAGPVCTPTRASIMTGKNPCDVQMYTVIRSLDTEEYDYGVPRDNTAFFETDHSVLSRHYLPLEETTIAELLKAKGYRTYYVGKWHLGHEPYHPVYQGFDQQIGTSNYGSPPSYFFPYVTIRNEQRRILIDLSKEGQADEYLTDRLTDEAMEFVEKNRNDPFFLSLNYHNPHTPLEGKPALVEYYKRKIPKESNARHQYAALVHVLDENVGRLVDRVRELGIIENTLIIFTSDNGGYRHLSYLEPLRGAKGSLYEGGVRVPVIISLEGTIQPGRNESVLVSTIDYLPTILAFAGAEAFDQEVRGKNLRPVLMGEGGLEDRDLFWYFPQLDNYLAVRQGNFKLIRNRDTGQSQLFDLSLDPGEAVDISGQDSKKTRQLEQLVYYYLEENKK